MPGEIFKQRREALGLDLREISNTLRIKYSYLKALEDGDIENLPPEVYVKGYIHEYAKVLDIDPDPIISSYLKLISQPEPGKLSGKTTQPKKRKTGYVLIPALLILAAIFISYLQQPSTDKMTESPVPAVETKKEAPPATESVPQRTTSGHLLQISAHDTTWLQVMIDKADLKELLMQPGDAVEWHAEERFSLKIGNAGGIKLRFDGKELTNLGEAGQVVTINLPETGT